MAILRIASVSLQTVTDVRQLEEYETVHSMKLDEFGDIRKD